MPKRKSPGQLAATFASASFRQFGELKRALQSAEASLSHLRSALHVPVIRSPRGRIAGSRTRPGFLLSAGESALGGFLSREITGEDGLLGDIANGDFSGFGAASAGNFQQSATQLAGKLFDASLRGQRIR